MPQQILVQFTNLKTGSLSGPDAAGWNAQGAFGWDEQTGAAGRMEQATEQVRELSEPPCVAGTAGSKRDTMVERAFAGWGGTSPATERRLLEVLRGWRWQTLDVLNAQLHSR